MQYFIIFVVLLVLELIYFRIADRYNIIDKPNERSSHTQITLRGGGVIFYFGALAFFVISGFQYPYFFLGLTLITLISFLDDIFTLSNKIRLFIQFASIFLMLYQVHVLSLPWWFSAIALVFCVGIINAYNFMDGINGITVSNSLAILALLALANTKEDFVQADLIYFSILACLVFAFFNFRQKAKAFAGDVGSVSIAFIILFLLALLMMKTGNFMYILFLSVYGVDSILTIVRRLSKKENIFEAHRTHLYQILANENGMNKLAVSFGYGILQFLIGLLVIFSVNLAVQAQVIIAVATLLIMGFSYLFIKRNLIRKFKIN